MAEHKFSFFPPPSSSVACKGLIHTSLLEMRASVFLTVTPKLWLFPSKIISFYSCFLVIFPKPYLICWFGFFPSFGKITTIQDAPCLLVKHMGVKKWKVKEYFSLTQAKFKGDNLRSQLSFLYISWYVLAVTWHIWRHS